MLNNKIKIMKTIIYLLAIPFIISCCSKSDDEIVTPAPVDQLPPATSIGANKIGCLVNGQVFLPHEKKPFGSPNITCFYQYVNGGYQFSLGFSNDQQTNSLRGVNIASHNLALKQGDVYPLINDNGNSAFASYYKFNDSQYFTNNLVIGELKISKLDQINSIISGTFWFDGINENGIKIEIREGRFDMQFTQ
jgi:hypothetical protein